MDVREGAAGQLEEARSAVDARSWTRGYELLTALRAEQPLGPEDLDRLAKAAYWTGDADGSIWAREEAYKAYLDRGEDERAAFCALTLRREHMAKLRDSVAEAWLSRAERLLKERPDSTASGHLAIAHADDARARGHFARAFSLLDRAKDIGASADDRDLRTWGAMRRGMYLIDEGRIDAGWLLIEEVAASATGGELGVYTTGAVLANVVTVCRDLGEFRRGIEWADAAMRWCERQHLVGFPGICRLHRAEILRMLGALREALDEMTAAVEELTGFSAVHAGVAQHELGEIRYRIGDLDAADEAFRRAHEQGEDPQPGLAMLRLTQGRLDAASSSIRLSLEAAASDRFTRAQLLQAYAEIAVEDCDAASGRSAAGELVDIADRVASPAIRAASEWASGIVAALGGDHEAAAQHLGRARDGWSEIGAPFEGAKAAAALAETLAASGDRAAATAELESAHATFERIGAQLHAARTAEGGTHAFAHGRATRTFLFTDIVGSTSLIEVIGDEAWTDLRRWHDQTLRASFAEHGGEEIDHAGDGFFVAFADAASAVACAIETQRRLGEHRRAHGFAPHVRMGLHASEAAQAAGSYAGLGVHAAARIAGLAGSGEILASEDTLGGLAGVRTSDHRAVTLKGIAEPVDVVVVDWNPTSR
jgi:class 3 adenylate cyclase